METLEADEHGNWTVEELTNLALPKRTVLAKSRSGLLVKTTCLVVFVAAGTAILHYAQAALLPVTVAVVFAMALCPPVRLLIHVRVPPPIAAFIVVSLLLVTLIFCFSHFARPVVAWFEEAPANVTRVKARLVGVIRPALRLREAAASVGRFGPADSGSRRLRGVDVLRMAMGTSGCVCRGSSGGRGADRQRAYPLT